MPPLSDSPFLAACRNQAADRVPVWFMRQAGRSLPEYRAIRGTGSILSAVRDADLAAEVTLQPVRRYGVDAAILYSDIVVPVDALGFGVEITAGVGPVVAEPFRTAADLDRLRPLDPAADCPYVAETVRLVVDELGDVPLIGFAGAPFTVATYAIEGKTSKRFIETKKLFYRHPETARRLLEVIGEATRAYLLAQVAAGAQAIQIFDSWLGVVSVQDWDELVRAPTAALVQAVRATGVPVIYFPNGATTILDRVASVGADVYGVDWRLPIDEARARLFQGGAEQAAVQGNLDPALLLGPVDRIERVARDIIARGTRRGHVFNLGHGIYPETPIASVEALVRTVKGA
jgi:uroporphyrinogen decarboxylase